ncbi:MULTISPECIES: hypothetical protein [unclassified Pseudomonas]|uniref:hypothetical protein n=1 Tax=unclassified Pseudomonas TaxID=196821 RepID=UPI000F6E6D11|nr:MULTISPECIES: hypothetical protein [unclassified Pseudomonas]AZF14952.1 hypothetical protein C4J92_1454 [Pseudomonas sp. R3-18-08]AZF46808.1 hypothetical protein C4J86_1559 [Pseudomonas sp. R2-7-07]AZF57319.1 hypothetical protein C4J84_1428 [Pseudomonas sp. R11-23-07]
MLDRGYQGTGHFFRRAVRHDASLTRQQPHFWIGEQLEERMSIAVCGVLMDALLLMPDD